MLRTKESLGYSSAFVSAVLMGTIGLFVRNISSSVQLITFARLFLSLIFLIILLVLTKQHNILKVKLSTPLFLSGVFIALTSLFYIESINSTTLSSAALLLYMAPIIATILAHFLLRERIGFLSLLLILIAFLGIGFLMEFDFSFNIESKYGYISGIASGITYSFYIVANRKIDNNIPLLSRTFYQFLFGALTIFPFLLIQDTGFTLPDIPYLLLLSFFNGFLALTLLTLALKHLETVKCGNILYVEPIIATAIGWILFSETISILQLTGGFMILSSGFLQATLRREKHTIK